MRYGTHGRQKQRQQRSAEILEIGVLISFFLHLLLPLIFSLPHPLLILLQTPDSNPPFKTPQPSQKENHLLRSPPTNPLHPRILTHPTPRTPHQSRFLLQRCEGRRMLTFIFPSPIGIPIRIHRHFRMNSKLRGSFINVTSMVIILHSPLLTRMLIGVSVVGRRRGLSINFRMVCVYSIATFILGPGFSASMRIVIVILYHHWKIRMCYLC